MGIHAWIPGYPYTDTHGYPWIPGYGYQDGQTYVRSDLFFSLTTVYASILINNYKNTGFIIIKTRGFGVLYREKKS